MDIVKLSETYKIYKVIQTSKENFLIIHGDGSISTYITTKAKSSDDIANITSYLKELISKESEELTIQINLNQKQDIREIQLGIFFKNLKNKSNVIKNALSKEKNIFNQKLAMDGLETRAEIVTNIYQELKNFLLEKELEIIDIQDKVDVYSMIAKKLYLKTTNANFDFCDNENTSFSIKPNEFVINGRLFKVYSLDRVSLDENNSLTFLDDDALANLSYSIIITKDTETETDEYFKFLFDNKKIDIEKQPSVKLSIMAEYSIEEKIIDKVCKEENKTKESVMKEIDNSLIDNIFDSFGKTEWFADIFSYENYSLMVPGFSDIYNPILKVEHLLFEDLDKLFQILKK